MYIAFIFVIDIVHMSLSVKSIFVVVMPFILLVMIQRVILRASTSRNKEKKQMLRVMIVGIIPLIVCAVQLSMNEYTSNFNRDRWLNDEEKRVHMVDDFMRKYKLIGKSMKKLHNC